MSDMKEADAVLARVQRIFETIPHGIRLGLEPVSYQQNALLIRLPYQAEIVGNSQQGFIHSGALSALVDQASGVAVMLAIDRPRSVATLDLRIDHLRPAKPALPLYAQAECYRMTRSIAFVRCVCFDESLADPVAIGMSTFMHG